MSQLTQQSFYHGDTSFQSVTNALALETSKYLANVLLKGELNRMLYEKTEYAFERRGAQLNQSTIAQLNFPFVNFKLTDTKPESSQRHWNKVGYNYGVPLIHAGKGARIKYRPNTWTFEGSYWTTREEDLDYATTQFNWEKDDRTNIYPQVQIKIDENDNFILPLSADLTDIDINYEPRYDWGEWKESGKLHSFDFTLTFNMFEIKTDFEVNIVDNVVLEYYEAYNGSQAPLEEARTFILNHLTETVEPA